MPDPQPGEMGGDLWAEQAAARRLETGNEPEPAPVAKKAAKKAAKKKK